MDNGSGTRKPEETRSASQRSMKAFVTGGSGFVGRDLLHYLVEQHGDTVVALSRSDKSDCLVKQSVVQAVGGGRGVDIDVTHHLSIVRGDVSSSRQLLQNWMTGCDVVYHLASRLPALADSWAMQLKETVEGTRNMLAAAKAAKVGKFVFVSSMSVLMTGPDGVFAANEDAAVNPPSYLLYAKAKSMAEEEVLRAATSTFFAVIVRPPFVHGPGDTTVLQSLRSFVEAGSLSLATPEDYLVSTISVRNLTIAIRLAATHGRSGRAYHFQDRESPMPARKFFTTYASCLPGLEAQVAQLAAARATSPTPRWLLANVLAYLPQACLPYFDRKLYSTRETMLLFNYPFSFSSDRSEAELGYKPPVSFQDSMKLTADWFGTNETSSSPIHQLFGTV